MKSTGAAVAVMLTLAVGVPLASYRLGHLRGMEGYMEGVWIPVVLAFLVGALACWLAPKELAPPLLALLCGIPLGILVDVVVDWFVFSRDRNLFPFEIILWELVLFVPGAFGVLICRSLLAMNEGNSEGAI